MKKKCKCKGGYKYITGTPQDIAALKKTIDAWSDEGYSIVITLIGKPGGCTPGHPC
jgi:hypothetical protein